MTFPLQRIDAPTRAAARRRFAASGAALFALSLLCGTGVVRAQSPPPQNTTTQW